jgi:hypothetical protein
MAHSDDNVSHGGLLLEDRPSRRSGPDRPAPHTDRWWLVDAPARTPHSRRGPAHHPSRGQTHSDGLPLGHLFEPVTPVNGFTWPDRAHLQDDEDFGSAVRPAAPVARALPQQTPHRTPPNGWSVGAPAVRDAAPAQRGAPALPRRRDVRNGRVAPPPPVISTPRRGIPLGLVAEPDTTFLPRFNEGTSPQGIALAPEPYTIDLSANPLPRRRDVRRAEQGDRSRRSQREARKSVLTDATKGRTGTTVARGAVLTGLVAVGVVTIGGQHLELSKLTPTGTPDATAELTLPSTAPQVAAAPAYEIYLDTQDTAWQAGPDARVAISEGLSKVKAKQVAAKKAAAKKAAEKAAAEARVAAKAEAMRNAQRNPRAIGRIMAAERGWTGAQWTALDKLWTRESQWKWNADNPSSSAYGIPQALPGRRMAANGSDWATNPVTQIAWGLDYIAGRYGNPVNAWAHSQRTGWY